jgi:rubrerythrin
MESTGNKRMKEILDQAINAEQAAYDLYDRAMRLVQDKQAQTVLMELRDEEKLHKEMLQSVTFDTWQIAPAKSTEKKDEVTITDFLVGGEIREDADFQEVLLFAAKKEAGAKMFYAGAAEMSVGEEEKDFFLKLSRMEEQHEKKCEALYWETYGGR